MQHDMGPLAKRVRLPVRRGDAGRPGRGPLCLLPLVLALSTLGGCAGMAWERGIYEGWRSAGQRGAPRDGAPQIDAPARLPSYDDYERERLRARNGDAVPVAPPAAASAAAGPGSAPAAAATR
jgi:hypothetical protein